MIGEATGAPITPYQDDAHKYPVQLNMYTNTGADRFWLASRRIMRWSNSDGRELIVFCPW